MVKGRPRTGKRTRRTRQQMLLEAEAVLMKRAPSSLLGVGDDALLTSSVAQDATSSSSSVTGANGSSNGNKKKSLRIMFQDAKNGKLAEAKSRKNYKYPRTVEAAQCPFTDPTGKNKMFFLIAIDLYPDSKIVQPSDSESESEEESGYRSYIDQPTDMDLSLQQNHEALNNSSAMIPAPNVNYVDADEAFINERSPSPVSPKVKRGRRPNNARRIPYGRATDIDHSWRSNYSRRNVRKPLRNRISDPEIIQNVINAVIERFTLQSVPIVTPPPSSPENNESSNGFGAVISDNNNNDSNNYMAVRKVFDSDEARSPTPVDELVAQNMEIVKQETPSEDSSSSDEEEKRESSFDYDSDPEFCNLVIDETVLEHSLRNKKAKYDEDVNDLAND